jgi:hypothetical protein
MSFQINLINNAANSLDDMSVDRIGEWVGKMSKDADVAYFEVCYPGTAWRD